MMALWISLASVFTYFGIGARLAAVRRPYFWASARREWHNDDEYARGDVRLMLILLFLFWPVVLGVQSFTRKLDGFAAKGDPKAQREKVEKLEQHIKDLERELGIGDKR